MEIENINDFLFMYYGAKLTRPLEEKTTMFVKNFDDTKWNKKKQPLPTFGMEKLDGVCCIAICIAGRTRLFTRTGRKMKNVEHLEGYLSLRMKGNRVMMMELCHPTFSLEEISGFSNPNRVERIPAEKETVWRIGSFLGIYDIISLDEFIAGVSVKPFQERLKELEEFVAERNLLELIIPDYIYAETEEDVEDFFNLIVSDGGEGIVRCLPEGLWQAGYKNHDKTKQVRGVDFDLKIIGVELGTKGKHKGIMNKLIVRWRKFGKPENPPISLAVDGRFDLCIRKEAAQYPERYIGKIAHVHALQLGSAGSLRLAKVRAVRIDKTIADL